MTFAYVSIFHHSGGSSFGPAHPWLFIVSVIAFALILPILVILFFAGLACVRIILEKMGFAPKEKADKKKP